MLLDPVGDVHALDVASLNDVGRVSGVRGPQVQVMRTLGRRTKGMGNRGTSLTQYQLYLVAVSHERQ